MKDRPALLGGTPVFPRSHKWPAWPYATRSDERRLARVLRSSGEWGIGAGVISEFASAFSKYLGIKHVLPVSTGTAALELAVKALDVGPGDQIIVPSYTFVATATCVLEVGATPVFADIDPETFNISTTEIERLCGPRTVAVIPVHFAGNPCDLQAVLSIARRRGVAVVEDAAHAHGMLYRGKAPGGLTHAACFSFQSTKNMTSGEGGALATNRTAIHETAMSLHSFGRLKGRPWYEHHVLAWNHRISGFQCAVLLGQLERLERQSRRRLRNGVYLDGVLSRIPGIKPQKVGDDSPLTRRAYHIYMFRYDEGETGINRQTFLDALAAEGVPASGGYRMPLQMNPMFTERRFWHSHRLGFSRRRSFGPDYTKTLTPNAARLCREAVWIPQYVLLASTEDVRRVAEAVARVVDSADLLMNRAFRKGRRM